MHFHLWKRRQVLTLLGGTAVAWPLAAARAQQGGKLPVIGYLNSTSPKTFEAYTVAFRRGLGAAGYVEGKSVTIEYRWAEGKNDRLPSLAAELVDRQVAVIAATGAAAGVHAAMAATKTIPIVFITGGDPVKAGFVASLNRPGGNVTGVSFLANTLAAKQLELLREVVPGASLIGVLVNPTNPALAEVLLNDVQAAARKLGLRLHVEQAANELGLVTAIESLVQVGASALMIGTDGFFTSRIGLLAELTERRALPAISSYRQFPASGGLLSYGTSLTDAYFEVGRYTAKILSGEKPAELPVLQPTKFELVINLKTAKKLAVEVPITLQVAADEVIE